MNNQDTGIRPSIPGQSVRAIQWHFGEDKEPELCGPVGTYVGRNPDANAEMDESGIFSFLGKEFIGDRSNSYAVVNEEPHTVQPFYAAINTFLEGHGLGNGESFLLTTKNGDLEINTSEELSKYSDNTYSYNFSDRGFLYSFNEDGDIIVICFSFYDHDAKKTRFFVPAR